MRWWVRGVLVTVMYVGPPGALGQPVPTQPPSGVHGLKDTAVTKAIELRIEGVETVAEVGGRRARPGYQFVIVDTVWKNIIPLTAVNRKAASSPTGGLSGFGTGRRAEADPADITMESTKYVASMPKRQVWLLSDDRFGETLDPQAQAAIPGGMPAEGFSIAKLDETLRGKFVFEAPANATYRMFQYYDTGYGHVAFALSGTKPAAPPSTLGPPRANAVVQLALTESGFRDSEPANASGLRAYVVGVRGTSRSLKDIVDVPLHKFAFLMNDQGCVAQPQKDPQDLSRPFGQVGSFPPTGANEGQLAFLIPANSRSARLLVRPAQGGAIDLVAGADFTPHWPTPAHTFIDGTTMKVHLLPAPARPAALPAATEGRRQVLVDVAIENLSKTQGIEFQTVQLRLALPDGNFADPSPLSGQVPCRLDGDGVVPAGGVRRFLLVYDVPADAAARVHFRGFELQEATADLP